MSARKKTTAAPRWATAKQTARRPAASRRVGSARRWRWPMAAGAAAVVAAFVALIVISASRSSSPGSSAAAASAPSGGGGSVGSQVTPFTLTSISGQGVSVPTPGRPGVIFFSESSCTSCIPSMQALSALKTRLGSRFSAVMVSVDPGDTAQYLEQWAALVGRIPFPLTVDTNGSLVSAYQVQYLGTTIIYNAQGRIVSRTAEPSMGDLQSGLRAAGVSA